jgi:hypothetical protein
MLFRLCILIKTQNKDKNGYTNRRSSLASQLPGLRTAQTSNLCGRVRWSTTLCRMVFEPGMPGQLPCIHLAINEWGNEVMPKITMEYFENNPCCQAAQMRPHNVIMQLHQGVVL